MMSYWLLIMRYQRLILSFIKSIRTADFKLNCAVSLSLIKYVFILDRKNYSRWMSVGNFDNLRLPYVNRDLFDAFVEKKLWVVLKSHRAFSYMAGDQGGEQNNRDYKRFHRQLGSATHTKYIAAYPEVMQFISRYEAEETELDDEEDVDTDKMKPHHEDVPSKQKKFYNDVQTLFKGLMASGNPCLHNAIVHVNNGELMEHSVAIGQSVRCLEAKGQQLYDDFFRTRLLECTVPLGAPITQQKILLPSTAGRQLSADSSYTQGKLISFE